MRLLKCKTLQTLTIAYKVLFFIFYLVEHINNDHKVHGRRIHCPDIMCVRFPVKMRKKSTKYDDNMLFSARNLGNYDDRKKVMVQLLRALKLPFYGFLPLNKILAAMFSELK